MKRRKSFWIAMLLALFLLPATVAAKKDTNDTRGGAEAEGSPALSWRLYSVHYLDLRQAGLMLEERIPEMLQDPQYAMRYEGVGGSRPGDGKPEGYLRVMTTENSHRQIAEILAEVDKPLATRVFNIVVLESTDDPTDQPELPPDAHDALHDLQTMLRFQGYRLVDSAMVRSSGHADVSLGSNYAIEIWFHTGPSEEKPLQVERFVLYSQIENHPRHMDTSFSMGVGETVVVGTSRPFDEDQALVVLLTALE